MKQKLTLLLLALFTTMGAWAIDVKIAETSSGLPTAAGFGSFSGQVFTTAAGSGLAGVTVTASSGLTIGEQYVNAANYGNCFKLVTAAASTNYTVTLTAPEGYFITGYYMDCSANSDGKRHTITPAGWAEGVVVSSPPYNNPVGPKKIEVTGLNTNSTSFTISTANEGNPLYLPTFTIYVVKWAPVTYIISDANGKVFTSDPIDAEVGTTITTLPASLQRDYCNYTVPSTVVAEEGNTINVTVDYTLPFTPSTSFSDAVWYYATLRGKFLRADDSAKDGDGRYQTNSTNEHTDAYKWAFFGNPYSNFYIANKNQGEGKYLYAGTNPEFQTIANPAADNKALWVPSANNAPGFTLRSVSGASLYINDAGNGGNLGYWNSSWGATDGGSRWLVEEAPASEVNVTYNVVFNNQVVATASEIQAVGGAPAVPASINFAFTSYTYDVDVIPGSATTVTATPTFNMPFETSTDYATATWYYLQGHASYSDRYVSTNGTEVVWSIGKGITEAYQWAFIGNPIEGIKLINKAAGNGFYLTDTNDATSMTNTPTAWVLKEQTASYSYGSGISFGLWSSAKSTYANCAGGTVKYWGSFDQGSTFWGEEVPDNYASNVEAEVKPWFDNYGGNFQLKTSVVEANQATYTSALVNCDLTTYEELLALLDDANNYVYPAAGFYRIKSSGKRIGESYIAYGQPSYASAGLITVTAANAATDASTVIKLTGADGQYTIATQGLYVQNQTTNNVAFPLTADAAGAATFSFIPYAPGVAVITNDGATQGYFHEAGWAVPAVVRWTASADASQWTVEEVTSLTVPLNGPVEDSYYATFCVPFDVTLDGATAYTLDLNATETALTMTEVEGTVAAGTPVLLKGTSASATASISTPSSTAISTETALTGTYVAKAVAGGTDYFLGMANGKVGFYHWDGSTLSANRAYLEASKLNNSGVKGFALDFEDDATGINNVNANLNLDEAIYNLAGQRLSKMQKGINIINGKKILK